MSVRLGHFDKDCLTSIVQNTSGVTRVFGFLPPHGVTLEPGETYQVYGNIIDQLGQPTDNLSRRKRQAFFEAIDRNDIAIISTPAPLLLDQTTQATNGIKLNNGTLSATPPCWETSDSLEAEVPA